MAGSIQIALRPSPTPCSSRQEKKNPSLRRSLSPITIWRCARTRSSKPISVAPPYTSLPMPESVRDRTEMHAPENTRVLVTGATGYIGGRLVPRLLARGYTVRVLARSPQKLADVPWAGAVEIVQGDLGDAGSVARAMAEVDVLYYLVHSMRARGAFETEEAAAARTVADAAREAGVRRIVYLGALHPDGALSQHLR